jgi:type I phosphodiesterase/nucleotide pyrophosphatase
LAPALADDLVPFEGRRAEGTVLVTLVDGLGWEGLRAWARGRATVPSVWARHAEPITTVFPSTTAAALVSLSTGVPPGRHGLVGYRQYLPRFGVVGDMLAMAPVGLPARDLLIGPTWKPSDLTGSPSLFRRGMRGTVVSRDLFEGSGLTRLLYDGSEYVGYATAAHLVHELVRVLSRPRPPPVVYLYWADLDTIQHLAGPDPSWTSLELDRFQDLLARVAGALPPRRARSVEVYVTGDHGLVPADVGHRVAIDEEPAIARSMLRPLAGDRRAGFFAARPGRLPALRDALRERLLPRTPIIDRDEVIRSGLFGPPPFHPEIEDRIGDLIAFVRSPQCLTYRTPGAAPATRFLRGAHGGVEAGELVVPLVRGLLSELGVPAAGPSASQR